MDKASAQVWADFLKKLGYVGTKKSIKDYILTHNLGSDEAWEYFVESNSEVKEAANANRIYDPNGIYAYFSEVSYAKMRGTYPRRRHGHSIIVPRLKTIRDIKTEKEKVLVEVRKQKAAEEAKCRAALMGVGLNSADLINKCILHPAFGAGTIIDYYHDGKIGYIEVLFQNSDKKILSYPFCLERGLLFD